MTKGDTYRITEVKTKTGLKLVTLRLIIVVIISWLLFSIYNDIKNEIYLSVVIFAALGLITVDNIFVQARSVTFERFYFYSLIKITWTAGQDSNVFFSLYSKREDSSFHESCEPAVDVIGSFIPLKVKVQGVIVRKGEAWFSRRAADFRLNDEEFATVSGCLRKSEGEHYE